MAYREAVAEGLLPDCGPDFIPRGFSSNSRPERMTMGYALTNFMGSLVSGNATRNVEAAIASESEEPLPDSVPELTADIRQGLESAGVSPSAFDGLGILLDGAHREVQRAADEIWPAKVAVHAMIEDYIERENLNPPEHGLMPSSVAYRQAVEGEDPRRRQRRIDKGIALQAAMEQRDDLYLSMEVGGERSDWQNWLPQVQSNYSAHAEARLLESLREQLSESDWTGLRRYLLATASERLSVGVEILGGPCEEDLRGWNPWQSADSRPREVQ